MECTFGGGKCATVVCFSSDCCTILFHDCTIGERSECTAVEDNFSDYLSNLQSVKGDSFLEELDDLNLEVWLKDTLRSSVAYMALVRKGGVQGGDDAVDARWFPVSDVPALAFDHDRILRIALDRLKEEIHFHPVGFELLPEVFTLPQLQALYEAILGVRFDRRNFAAKMLKLGILTPTGDRPADAARRIPQTFRFNPQKYGELKQSGFRLEF